MNEHEIRAIVDDVAKKAAKEAVKEIFLTLGIRTDDALEVQADMQHLREWRQAGQTIKKQGIVTAVGIITAGVLGLIWLAIKGA